MLSVHVQGLTSLPKHSVLPYMALLFAMGEIFRILGAFLGFFRAAFLAQDAALQRDSGSFCYFLSNVCILMTYQCSIFIYIVGTLLGLHRDDLALPEERRRRMFEAEAKAALSEERDAAVAKSILEVRPFLACGRRFIVSAAQVW